MATRSIVTSQPDIACDVCERRLLRGEQPDLFLQAGQRRMVCDLCAPRAAHQGWKRDSAEHSASAAPARARRGRGLFERLRGTRRAELEPGAFASERLARDPEGAESYPAAEPHADAELYAGPEPDPGAEPHLEQQPYDFLTVDAIAGGGSAQPAAPGQPAYAHEDGVGTTRASSAGARQLQQAIDAFNAGEYTRRVASLARSLGAPEVTVRPGEAVASSVAIVIAWELCWYAYEVDLDDRSKIGQQGTDARSIAQGTELSELAPHDRLGNARADERGMLALL
jgi:hypothetical protein